MKSRAFNLTLLSTIAISIAASLPAQAQRARVFVSVNGNDSNPCTALSPCRTFQAAHDAALPGGEIDVMDTGGYGPLTITKAISVVNPLGVVGSIATASRGTAITIKAGPNDTIALRGLNLDGSGLTETGIEFDSGYSLTITDCVVRNMTINGLIFFSYSSSDQSLVVSNSQFNDNTGTGIAIQSRSSGSISATIEHAGLSGNVANGLFVGPASGTGTVTVAVTDSVAASNFAGVVASTLNQSTIAITLTHVLLQNNNYGAQSTGTNAAIFLGQSTLTGNTEEFSADHSGVIYSYGDNYAAANVTYTGSLTPATKQ
jgi:hypothetical protein